jgi:phosphatidate cytidylyltransferase
MLRIVTGLALIPVVLAFVLAGGWWYTVMVMLLAGIGVLEFCLLGATESMRGHHWIAVALSVVVIGAFFQQQPVVWLVALLVGGGLVIALEPAGRRWRKLVITLAAVGYIAFPAAFLASLRGLPDGLMWSVVVYGVASGADTFAYAGGRLFGKTRLAPLLSPGKTVEGMVAGIVGGVLVGAIMLLLAGGSLAGQWLPLFIATALAIAGDLLESGVKRIFAAKDSRLPAFNLMPGHGGVLDRIDALIPVATFYYFYILVSSTIG